MKEKEVSFNIKKMRGRNYVFITIISLASINIIVTDSNICLKEATVFKTNPRELREYACKDYCKQCSPDNPAAVSIPGCEHCCCHERSIYEKKNRVIERLENQIKEEEKIDREKDKKINSLEMNIKNLYKNFSSKEDPIYVNKNADELKPCKTRVYILSASLAIALLMLLYYFPGKRGLLEKIRRWYSFCKSYKRRSERSDICMQNQSQKPPSTPPQLTSPLLTSSPLTPALDDVATDVETSHVVDIPPEIVDCETCNTDNTPKIPALASENDPKSQVVTNSLETSTKESVQEAELPNASQLHCGSSSSKKSEEEPFLSDLDQPFFPINESVTGSSCSRGSTPLGPECKPYNDSSF